MDPSVKRLFQAMCIYALIGIGIGWLGIYFVLYDIRYSGMLVGGAVAIIMAFGLLVPTKASEVPPHLVDPLHSSSKHSPSFERVQDVVLCLFTAGIGLIAAILPTLAGSLLKHKTSES